MFKNNELKILMAAALVAAAGSVAITAQADIIKVDGSSTVFPITEAVAEDFQKAKRGSQVTVGISGTGGGFKKFCRGETDISNASRPITKSEMEICAKEGIKYIELPVAYDALTVVINPKNTFAKTMTVAELKKIWEPDAQGKIKKWNQVNPAWPDSAITLYGAGSDSGTFDYFTEAINGKSKASRGDYTASEDDNVLVSGVQRDTHALGYFGYAYYAENTDKMTAVAVVNKEGKAVGPSEQTVVDGSYNPLSRPIFIYVKAASLDRPEVKDFIEFYMKNAATLVEEVKYVALPSKAYSHNLDMIAKKEVGTKFGGTNKIGITIEQLMAMEAK